MTAADPNPTPLELVITNVNTKEIRETECSNRQIADLLSLSEENVRVHLHRARKKLAARLKKEVKV